MAQSACSDNSMCGPTVGTPPRNFLLAQVPAEGARVTRAQTGRNLRVALFLGRTGGPNDRDASLSCMNATSAAIPADMANSSLTVWNITGNTRRARAKPSMWNPYLVFGTMIHLYARKLFRAQDSRRCKMSCVKENAGKSFCSHKIVVAR